MMVRGRRLRRRGRHVAKVVVVVVGAKPGRRCARSKWWDGREDRMHRRRARGAGAVWWKP